MNRGRLILRNLVFFRATHLGVVLGVAVGAAVLTGALLVGDSVRRTLREQALLRIGQVDLALTTGDRMFSQHLVGGKALGGAKIAYAIQMRGIASAQGGARRALDVQVLGVKKSFFALAPAAESLEHPRLGEVYLNERLAAQLQAEVGERVVLRVELPAVMPREAVLGSGSEPVRAVALDVSRILTDEEFGRFDLTAAPHAPHNAYVHIDTLRDLGGPAVRPLAANVLLVDGASGLTVDAAHAALREKWHLTDAGLTERYLQSSEVDQLENLRILIERPVEEALARIDEPALGISTYLANELRVGDRTVPYSLISALGPVTAGGTGPIVWRDALPEGIGDDGIAINTWVAEDLQAGVGDELALSYWHVGPDEVLTEKTRTFTIGAIVPVEGLAADRRLMPGIPGISDADSCREWDIGLPIDYDRVRDRDEEWWDEHEGTPKAYLTLAAGRAMWGSERFGFLTAVRYPWRDEGKFLDALRAELDPVELGLSFRDVRTPALAASSPATDFGGLFLGLSFFLLGAAFLLVGLLLALGVLQRASEVGTLLALGFRPKTVRRMLFGEAAFLAAVGSAVGALAAAGYARLVLFALGSIWEGAVAGAVLTFHASPGVVALGGASSFVVAVLSAWLTLRRQAKLPAVELLTQRAGVEVVGRGGRRVSGLVALVAGAGAIGATAWGFTASGPMRPAASFAAGSLALVALLAACRFALRGRRDETKPSFRSLAGLAWSNATRRPARSMATIVLLACGSFLVVVVGANRKGAPDDPTARSAGTGGFALVGRSSMAIVPDRTVAGPGFRLTADQPEEMDVVPLRVRAGDDASCLNLSRPQEPRLVGVRPTDLATREAFTFATVLDHDEENPWLLLARNDEPDVIPAIGDAASVMWSMHKGLGDTIGYVDEAGRPFEVRIVGTLAGSILQGDLVIDEARFRARFPAEAGYRMFLVDAPPDRAAELAATMMQELGDLGLELETTTARLAAFDAVQNTYLVVFQILGALGLLLGSVGLGVVVLRNVAERRGELAVLAAVGFRPARVQHLLLAEHGLLLTAGTGCGTLGALVAILPLLPHQGGAAPVLPVLVLLVVMLALGMLWVWLAARLARRGLMLEALGRAC